MSTTTPEKPPAVAMKDTLDEISARLALLVAEHQKQGDASLLLADCRDTMTEAVGIMHSQGSDILQRAEGVEQLVRAIHAPHPARWPRWAVWLSGGMVALALLGAAWLWWPRPTPYQHLLGGVDTVLVQSYATLPKPVQEQLSAVYAKQGIQGPGQRQKGSTR